MRSSITIAIALAGGCASSLAPDPGLEDLALSKVAPDTIIPGTKVVLTGESFVEDHWGDATLHLVGKAGGSNVDVHWPAVFVDFGTMTVAIDGGKVDDMGGDVDFDGTATVEVVAASNGITYSSGDLSTTLAFRKKLTPTPTGVIDGVIFVNDQIEVDGDGFLLGGDEGTTFARLAGCFTPDSGGGCAPVTQLDLPMTPLEALSRKKSEFAFSPKLAGIKPGTFTGTVTILNQQTTGGEVVADPITVGYTLVTSQVFSADPPAASLGQYVFIHGGGFVGGEAGAVTELELTGTFNRTGGNPAPAQMNLIPEFVEGRLVRYVINTDDALGHALDLRMDTGHFTGTVTPIVTYGSDSVRGVASQITFDIAPVRQVVFLDFQASYVEELRDFGMRAVNKQIRDRILAVLRRSYLGVNVEFRTEAPTDYSLFEHVEIVGVDPNDQGLFGYDNSPGKDNGNLRLYDRLGGVNATTQEDGYPGFGGVFVRSLMGFSKHPGSFTHSVPGADSVFDNLFDPFRQDQDGSPITASDLAGGVPQLTDGSVCPAGNRTDRIACAVFVMGNLIGGTMSHEIGHSLGLANPYMEGFHDAGDAPNRLMDAGGDRPFLERAELQGQGPGVFCDDEYAYLRQILPSKDPSNDVPRPMCF